MWQTNSDVTEVDFAKSDEDYDLVLGRTGVRKRDLKRRSN
jgi:hypothetical protein